jgi:hypothetical protein
MERYLQSFDEFYGHWTVDAFRIWKGQKGWFTFIADLLVCMALALLTPLSAQL